MEPEKVEVTGNPAPEATPEVQETDLTTLSEALAAEKEAAAAPVEPAQEPDEYIQPPSSWKPELKASWAKYDKALRAQVYAREQDFHKGLEQYKGGHQRWEKLEKEVLSPYMARIQSAGIPPEQFVKEFLTLDHVFINGTPQQKQQAFQAVVKYYGLDQYLQPTNKGQEPPQPQLDPTVQKLQEELAQLKGTLTQSQTAAEQREKQEALSAIESFKADPKHVYFDDVREEMAVLLNSGKAKDLADAYDQACWAKPNVRAALLKQQRDEEEKKRIEEAKRKAADARRAGFDVQAQGAAQPGVQPKSLRAELAELAGVQLTT